MPNGTYPVPRFRPRPEQAHGRWPSIRLRLRTRWRRDLLDEQLAAGAGEGSPELELRAVQLRSPSLRSRLAKDLERIVREARARPMSPTARLAPRRANVRECVDDLLALAQRLRAQPPVDGRGVAMARLLLTDGLSPLYERGSPQSLRHAVRSARLALDPPGKREDALPRAA